MPPREYLATFKKTVAMHEMFLTRLACHPVFSQDETFRIFLQYDQDLSVRGKNKLEKIGSFMNSVSMTTDEYLLSAKVKDISEFFEREKSFLINYHNHLKDANNKADKMTRKHRDVADCYLKISTGFSQLSTIDLKNLDKFLVKVAETFEKARVSQRIPSFTLRLGDDNNLMADLIVLVEIRSQGSIRRRFKVVGHAKILHEGTIRCQTTLV